jgi:hypothetical protein
MKILISILVGILIGANLALSPDVIMIPLKSGQDGHLDGRVVHFNRTPHNYAKLQKTGQVYELRIYYPNGKYYNIYPFFPSKEPTE